MTVTRAARLAIAMARRRHGVQGRRFRFGGTFYPSSVHALTNSGMTDWFAGPSFYGGRA